MPQIECMTQNPKRPRDADQLAKLIVGVATGEADRIRFALEDRRLGLFGQLNRDLIKYNMSLSFARQPMWPLFAFWFSIGIILLLLVGGRQVILGTLTLGELVQFIQLFLPVFRRRPLSKPATSP